MPKSIKTKRLRDSYRFPGFHPALTVAGVFGDPHAFVIRLTRRSKKRRAEFVVGYRAGGMTANCAVSEIFRLACRRDHCRGRRHESLSESRMGENRTSDLIPGHQLHQVDLERRATHFSIASSQFQIKIIP